MPGMWTAWGMLAAPVVRDFSATFRTVDPSIAAIRQRLAVIAADARRACRVEGNTRVELQRSIDVRYHGQSYELTVEFCAQWRAAFHRAHAQRFGHCDQSRPLEVVTVRVQARGRGFTPPIEHARRGRPAPPLGRRAVRFGHRVQRAAMYLRESLVAGQRITGPAVVCEYSATTVLPPGWSLCVERHGGLVLEPQHA